jgi:predicted MPP superfamily phosphohydrolase
MSRRRFIAGLGIATTSVAVAGYVRGVEPHWLDLNERTVDIGSSGEGIRLLHLSDLHASSVVSQAFLREVIERSVKLRPDLICVTGDFVTVSQSLPADYADILRLLSLSAPTFGSLGNHDGGSWAITRRGSGTSLAVRQLLSAAGITCLLNQQTVLKIRDREIELVGLGDLWSRECRPQQVLQLSGRNEHPLRVVLSHNPDSKELLAPYDWDVLLCGHTHGGQVGLPFFAKHFAPVVDKKYIRGLHRWDNRWLHISRGVGNLYGLRFNCRPEATLLRIKV